MAEINPELRAALLAFCHAHREANPKSFESDEDFDGYVEHVLNSHTGWAEGFRVWYIMEKRYPTYRELQGPPIKLLPPPPPTS